MRVGEWGKGTRHAYVCGRHVLSEEGRAQRDKRGGGRHRGIKKRKGRHRGRVQSSWELLCAGGEGEVRCYPKYCYSRHVHVCGLRSR